MLVTGRLAPRRLYAAPPLLRRALCQLRLWPWVLLARVLAEAGAKVLHAHGAIARVRPHRNADRGKARPKYVVTMACDNEQAETKKEH